MQSAKKRPFSLSRNEPLAKKPKFNSVPPPKTGSAVRSTSKRLVIKSLKNVPALPSNFQEITWEKLSKAIHAIHHAESVSDSKESLYNSVQDLCTHKMAASIYENLRSLCKNHLVEQSKALYDQCQSLDSISFLPCMSHAWDTHCTQMRMIRDIFLYLDRTYAINEPTIKSIWDMGLVLFRTEVITSRQNEISEKVISGILSLIERERNNEQIQRGLIQNLIRMLSSLQLYHESFEQEFLQASQSFYEREGIKRIDTDPVPYYLSLAEKRLNDERDRVRHYLELNTEKPLLSTVDTFLIEKHASTLLEKGFNPMMQEDSQEVLQLFFRQMLRVGLQDQMKSYFNQFIKVFFDLVSGSNVG